jgi:hypothetical protein
MIKLHVSKPTRAEKQASVYPLKELFSWFAPITILAFLGHKFIILALIVLTYLFPISNFLSSMKPWILTNKFTYFAILISLCAQAKYVQRKLRFRRLKEIKMKYRFSKDPASYTNMTMEQAQEVERNMAEYEFPHLWQFGWISDFLRTSTDPGVSRAIANSGHFLHKDPLISHRRQQDTIHLMTAIAAYPVKSEYHSLAVARINEHVSMNFLGSSFLSQHTVAHMHVAIAWCGFLGQLYSLGIFIRLHGPGTRAMQVPVCFVSY